MLNDQSETSSIAAAEAPGPLPVAVLGAGTAGAQETPRKGGAIRMTAPYAASFGSLDPHTTPRACDCQAACGWPVPSRSSRI